MLINALILIGSLVVLNEASHLTITNSVKVADITGLGKTAVGFILVAFSTSIPEFSVAIFSALGEEAIGVSIGNVLGSNIVNICLILGLCILVATSKRSKIIKLVPFMTKEDIGSLHFGLFIASIIPLTLLYVGYASRFIGIILLGTFILYTYYLSRAKMKKEEGTLGREREKLTGYALWTLVGIAGVVATSYFIVDSASYIALNLGVPRVVIGATIVAFGTSVPELATGIKATREGHLDLTFGNVIGSCFINTTCILGVTLVVSTLSERVNMAAFSNLVMFSLIVNLFLWYFLSSERMSWREGGVLLFLYFLFLAISFGGQQS